MWVPRRARPPYILTQLFAFLLLVVFAHSVVSYSLWPMECSTPGLLVYHQLLEFTQTHVHWVGDAIQPSHPLLPPSPALFQSFPTSGSFPMSWLFESRWPKYLSFSFNISPSNEYSGLISFRTDWFYLHEVQGTLKSLLQHHSLKASILWGSTFFMVQLSDQYMTTRKP